MIGAHKPDLKGCLLGPNAARVVRHSKCSVLVVRQARGTAPPRRDGAGRSA